MKGIKVDKNWLEKGQARLYVKKPLPIMARQINQTFWVEALEGKMQGKEGDYLISGIQGELYLCDREIFEESYKLIYPNKYDINTDPLNPKNQKKQKEITDEKY